MAVSSFPGFRFHAYPSQFSGRPATLVEQVTAVPAVEPEIVSPDVAVALPQPRRSRRGLLLVLLVLFAFGLAGGTYVFFVLQVPAAPVATPTPTAPTPAPQPTPEPTPAPAPEPTTPIPGTDTDSDGLTNVEELLYATDFRNPDSDGDTFLDGNEVFHRYNPGAADSSTLLDAGTVSDYTDGENRFSVTFPTSWRQTVSVEGNVDVRAPSLALFSLTVLPKETSQTLDAWYSAQTTLPPRTGASSYLTKMGYTAIAADDDRFVALDGGDTVFLFRYSLENARTVEYLQTFKMVVNSFRELP